jgi:phosphate transport system substrate-binding protein
VAAAFVAGTPAAADDTAKKDAGSKVDAGIEGYKPVSGISGNISSVGSDTLNNLMNLWLEGFKKHYPNVKSSMEGKGSGTAPTALIDGTADLGPMSRPMKADEIKKFEDKFGYKPTEVRVALDALAVFVHKDNPVEKLSLPQVDAIFSKNRLGKHPEDVTKWGQAGLAGDWQNLGITLYGRNNASGTYGYFKEVALFKGDYKDSVKEQPGSSTVVQLISEDRTAIGYSGIGYKTAGVRTVPLSKGATGEAYDATAEHCYSGKYPLSRFLLVYVNKPEGKKLNPVVTEFLKFVQAKEGQEVVVKEGFIPLRKSDVDKQAGVLE